MQKVKSFQVDHRVLEPGIYESEVNGAYTYDIRFIAPRNAKQQCPSGKVLHTLEHFFADYFRNKTPKSFSNSVLYIGPMGCKTGFYLVTVTPFTPEAIHELLRYSLTELIRQDTIPGADSISCGNHEYFDLLATKRFIKDVITPNLFEGEKLNTFYPFIK